MLFLLLSLTLALATDSDWEPTAGYCKDLRIRTREMFGVLPEDATQIEPGLWLSNVCGAVDTEFLALHKVTRTVSMAGEWCVLRSRPGLLRQCLSLDDSVTQDAVEAHFFLRHGADLIEHGRALNETVLVHCNMGVSRSSAAVIRYLLNRDPRLTYEEALAVVRRARPIAQPNALFESLLNSPAERKRRWKAKHDLR